MVRDRRPALTLEQLYEDGGLIRLRDIVHITTWDRRTIIAAIEAGALIAIRRLDAKGCPYVFTRQEVRAWLQAMETSRVLTPVPRGAEIDKLQQTTAKYT